MSLGVSCGGFYYKFERTGIGTVLVPLQYCSYQSFITKGTLLEQRHAAPTPLHCAAELKPPQLTLEQQDKNLLAAEM